MGCCVCVLFVCCCSCCFVVVVVVCLLSSSSLLSPGISCLRLFNGYSILALAVRSLCSCPSMHIQYSNMNFLFQAGACVSLLCLRRSLFHESCCTTLQHA